jgi:hypothetical protein
VVTDDAPCCLCPPLLGFFHHKDGAASISDPYLLSMELTTTLPPMNFIFCGSIFFSG